MKETREAAIRVRVDPANPGQFFACCGLLELADRFWDGAEGWFEGHSFSFRALDPEKASKSSFGDLLRAVAGAPLRQVDLNDDFSSPIELPAPFGLRLDWWKDERSGGNRLKVWAGSMRSVRIARAMQSALGQTSFHNELLFDLGEVVYDPGETNKKVEPFYFDARRGASAQSIDIGFAPDSLQMTSIAYPGVEFLCLVGLQRFRPMPTDIRRIFEYYIWMLPMATPVAPAVACGLVSQVGRRGFRFENAFRTDQRKHKAFTPATPI